MKLDSEIDDVEKRIRTIMDSMDSPILTIPGINYRMGAMILAEIGDFSRFSSACRSTADRSAFPSNSRFNIIKVLMLD